MSLHRFAFCVGLAAFGAARPCAGQELIPQGAEWRYRKGAIAPPAAWKERSFDDSAWEAGPTGIGYGDGDDATVLNDMENGYIAVFARRRFDADPAEIARLVLRIRYDDGFVAYLNGAEAARRSLGAEGTAVAFDAPADDHEAQGFESIDLTSKIPLLVAGTNVLAIEIHNRTLDSSDLSLDPVLAANEDPTCGPYPPGFCVTTYAGGFTSPVAVAFTGDGRMLVAERRGLVWVVEGGNRKPDPFIDLQAEINNAGDRGLLGIEVDRNFSTNGHVYFLHVVDPMPGSPEEASESITFGRLTRYTAVGDAVDPASRKMLIGTSAQDGFIHCHSSHAIGSVKQGLDGGLFAGTGDGGHFDFTDGGQDVTAFDAGCATTFGAANDIGALRSQRLDSLAGKLVRIDPDTGLGLPDNPYFDGDASSVRSRVWVSGLRNPFRFTVRPDTAATGTLFVGDVGWNAWEELNAAHGGENFGWPCYEGSGAQSSYQTSNLTRSACQVISSAEVTAPVLAWDHSNAGTLGFVGNCVSGACFYTGSTYPAAYQGALFFSDYGQNWMRVLRVDDADQLLGVNDFASGLQGPVDIESDPISKDLFYVALGAGEVRRIEYTVGNRSPIVSATGLPTSGVAPLDVQVSGAGTVDPDGDSITYEWNFGDGSPLDTNRDAAHTYAAAGTFTATLTASDDRGGVGSKSVVIQATAEPLNVAITSPPAGTRFYGGEEFTLRADVTGPSGGDPLPREWVVNLLHDTHVHPEWFVSNELEPVFTAESHGDDEDSYSYEITVTVRNVDAQTASASVDLLPGAILRGDGNADATIDISDAVLTVLHLFEGVEARCALALDADGSGTLQVTDAIAILGYLFQEGPPPRSPFPQCGVAANPAALPCQVGCP